MYSGVMFPVKSPSAEALSKQNKCLKYHLEHYNPPPAQIKHGEEVVFNAFICIFLSLLFVLKFITGVFF